MLKKKKKKRSDERKINVTWNQKGFWERMKHEEARKMRTFRALPCVPQILHADELVITMKAVVLGFGVVVVQVLSQELWGWEPKENRKNISVTKLTFFCKKLSPGYNDGWSTEGFLKPWSILGLITHTHR